MNLQNEYKNEVGSMSLSAEFKEKLKQSCIQEIENGSRQINVSESSSRIYSKLKLYKYVSIAACLMAVISTIGVMSILSSRLNLGKSSLDTAMSDKNSTGSNYVNEEPAMMMSPESVETESDSDTYDIGLSDDFDNYGYTEDASAEAAEVDSNAIDNDDSNVQADEFVPEPAAFDSNSEYSTYDYVLGLNKAPQYEAGSIYSDSKSLLSIADGSESRLKRYSPLNFYDILDTQLKDSAELTGVSLVKMTINGVTDAQSESFDASLYTPYNATIQYDYLNLNSCDIDATIWIIGTQENQIDGMPPYSEGDTIFTSLFAADDGSITVIDHLLYDVYSLSGMDIAYHRYYDNINPGSTDMGILDVEREFVTTSGNNPVRYVHKATVKELSRYIRRKVVSAEYDFVDLKLLADVSNGDAELSQIIRQPESSESPENNDEQDDTQTVEPIKNARVTTTDEKLIIELSGHRIMMNDADSAQILEEELINSISGSSDSNGHSIAMFIGGKLTFDSYELFKGGIIDIEVTNAGCPLNISINGVKVGDTLEDTVNLLGIRNLLDENCKLIYKADTATATLYFKQGVLAKITVKLN